MIKNESEIEIMENKRNENLDSFSIKVIQEESEVEIVEIMENERNKSPSKDNSNSMESNQIKPDAKKFV